MNTLQALWHKISLFSFTKRSFTSATQKAQSDEIHIRSSALLCRSGTTLLIRPKLFMARRLIPIVTQRQAKNETLLERFSPDSSPIESRGLVRFATHFQRNLLVGVPVFILALSQLTVFAAG